MEASLARHLIWVKQAGDFWSRFTQRFAEGFGSFAPFLAYLIFVWVLLISILRILIKKSFDRRFLLVEVTMECIGNIKCCTFPLISILNFVLMFFFLINRGSLSSKFLVIFIFSDQWIFLPSMLQVQEQLSIFPLSRVSYIDQIKWYHKVLLWIMLQILLWILKYLEVQFLEHNFLAQYQ